MDTDFSSLERELRGPSDHPIYQEPEEVAAPDPYSELAERYGGGDEGEEDDGYLRKSG